MPGTGRVVMYMVTQRYRYSVPMRKKNRLLAIDLKQHEGPEPTFIELISLQKVKVIPSL